MLVNQGINLNMPKIINFDLNIYENLFNDLNYNGVYDYGNIKNNESIEQLSCLKIKIENCNSCIFNDYCVINNDYLIQKNNFINNLENVKFETIYTQKGSIISEENYLRLDMFETILNIVILGIIFFVIWFVLFPKKFKNKNYD